MKAYSRIGLVALFAMPLSCALEFGIPPDLADGVADWVGGDVVDGPLEACEPIYGWDSSGPSIDFTNLVDGTYKVVGAENQDTVLKTDEVHGVLALEVQENYAQITVTELYPHHPDSYTVRVFVPSGSEASVWSWFGRQEGPGGADEPYGVWVTIENRGESHRFTLGVDSPSANGPKSTTREVSFVSDDAAGWFDIELMVFPLFQRVTADFSLVHGGELWGEDTGQFESLELTGAHLYEIPIDGVALFVAGSTGGAFKDGTGGNTGTGASGHGVAWHSAVQNFLTHYGPRIPEECSVCDWHRTWNQEPSFSDAQCACLTALTPEGSLSSDPGSTYCAPSDVGGEVCYWDDEMVGGSVGLKCTAVDPALLNGIWDCHQWQQTEGWESCHTFDISATWDECVGRDCIPLPASANSDEVGCAFVPILGPDTCACLEESGDGSDDGEPFTCDLEQQGRFVSATIGDELFCGVCQTFPLFDCGFAQLARCESDNPCLGSKCSDEVGCVVEPVPNGLPCDDENPQTSYSLCLEGECVDQTDGCDPSPCSLVGNCEAQAFTFSLDATSEFAIGGSAWMTQDRRVYVANGLKVWQIEQTAPGLPPTEGNVWSLGGAEYDWITIQSVSGNDLGELFIGTEKGLLVADLSTWPQSEDTQEPAWARVPQADAKYVDIWTGPGIEGAPVHAVGVQGSTLTRKPGLAWTGWEFEQDWLFKWNDDLTPGQAYGSEARVHGIDAEHIVTIAYDEDGKTVVLMGHGPGADPNGNAVDMQVTDVTQSVLTAIDMVGGPYHFSDVWASPSGHVYVISSAGHLAKYTPIVEASPWPGSWASMELDKPPLAAGYMAISGRQVGNLEAATEFGAVSDVNELVVVGEHDLIMKWIDDGTEQPWTPHELSEGKQTWTDVHMAEDGSFVATTFDMQAQDNVFIWLETGACACEYDGDAPAADQGCLIARVQDACEPVYAPVGTLCDDGDEETVGDRCYLSSESDQTLCLGTPPCDGVEEAFVQAAATSGLQGASCVAQVASSPGGGGPYCSLIYHELEPCDDLDLSTWSAHCMPEEGLVSLQEFPSGHHPMACTGVPIECPASAPQFEPCFESWEAHEGASYLPKDGSGQVDNCTINLKPPGASCDDGNAGTFDDICADGGTCSGSTAQELQEFVDAQCEPFGDGYLTCPGLLRDWGSAQAICESLGGWALVVIDDEEEHAMVTDSWLGDAGAPAAENFWIGLQDLDNDGSYVWSDGVAWSESVPGDLFDAFLAGEPNNANANEQCVESRPSGGDEGVSGWGWNDLPCKELLPFVCEKLPECGDGKLSIHLEECDPGADSWVGCTPDCLEKDQAYCEGVAQDDPCIKSGSMTYDGDTPIGCEWTYEPEGVICEDGPEDDLCIPLDVCDGAGVCLLVDDLNCEGMAGPCEYFGCNSQSGCTITPMPAGESCSDAAADIDDGLCLANGKCMPAADMSGCTSFEGGSDATDFVLCTEKKTWTAAKLSCETMGGSLASIDSELQNADIGSHAATFKNFNLLWIGLHDIENEGVFTWMDGEAPTFTNWDALSPNNIDGDRDCVAMWMQGQNDQSNDEKWTSMPCGDDPGAATTETAYLCDLTTPAPATWFAVEISAGEYHTCALASDGQVVCWGADMNGQSSPPEGTFYSLTSGHSHSCALEAVPEGEAICWGHSFDGKTDPPPDGGPYVALGGGGYFTCGIDVAGNATCWGSNTFGQTEVPAVDLYEITGGIKYGCGLSFTQEIFCWGTGTDVPGKEPEGDGFHMLTGGSFHACALNAMDMAVCWGSNEQSQLDVPDEPLMDISAGEYHTCGVTFDGQIICWGWSWEVLGTPPEGKDFVLVDAGTKHTCAIDVDGQVTCWGSNGDNAGTTYGQSDPPSAP